VVVQVQELAGQLPQFSHREVSSACRAALTGILKLVQIFPEREFLGTAHAKLATTCINLSQVTTSPHRAPSG